MDRLLRSAAWRLVLVGLLAATLATAAAAPMAGAAASSTTTGVVEMQLQLLGGAGAATGMVLTPSGEILTNNHVVRGATSIRVHVPENGRTYSARVLGYSISADVALLKLRAASGLRTVSLGNSSTVELGQSVTAVGNAGGAGTLTTKDGTINALGRAITVRDESGEAARLTGLFGTSADLEPGDSGGPLLDDSGRVVAMNAAASLQSGFRSGDTNGFAIPINRATAIVRQIESRRSSSSVHIGATPFLGITADTSGSVAGVLVAEVKAGSPAARAGIAAGDAIVAVNGHAVRNRASLVSLLVRWHPGDRVRVAWVDALGDRHSATVTLASGPPQ